MPFGASFFKLGTLITLSICCAGSIVSHPYQSGDQETAHETLRLCPRNLDNVENGYRRCLRACVTDGDCKGRKKKCLCDGGCGMSCIKQSTKCAPLIDPTNGKVHTTGIEAFGAKVFYTCQPDFRLKGPRSRSCQGDATWSGDAPVCQPDVRCEDPPEVPHAQHNADWRHHTYELDTMIQYTCESGYAIEGFARAKCIYFNGTAKWFGPDLRCVPRDCGQPAAITSGYREGDLFHYPHRIKYHCYPGFNLIGKPIRHCQRNGKWDGENPICKAVECSRPPDPYNGFAIITSLKYESAVRYSCKPGYLLVRGQERRCQANQTWSGPDPKCEVVNCGPPTPIINGGYNGTSTTFNSVIFYYCKKGTKFGGTANSAKCQADGNWSHPAPKCFAPCTIPYIEHGTASASPGDHISHGDVLSVSCAPKYELAYSLIAPKCDNGTFLYVPTCHPASCKTPPVNPRRGLVIAPKTDHGMKARFVCNKGYRILGADTAICEFGNWTVQTPTCQEVYCPWPGLLGNGTIFLVGAMGSYEYFSYIKTVVQDRQIRYECNKGFFLHGGPSGATCVDGNWSPTGMPKCYPGLHPPQSLFGPRVKRAVPEAPCNGLQSDRFEQSNILRDPDDFNHYLAAIKCRAGFVPNLPNGKATCRNGVWTPRKPECLPLTCRVPETMNGQFKRDNTTIPAWSEISDTSSIHFICFSGYQTSGPNKLLCSTGQFMPPVIPECVPASCPLTEINHGTYDGGYRNGLQVAHNSIISFHCADGYRKSPNSPVRCDLGKLTPKAPECLSQQSNTLRLPGSCASLNDTANFLVGTDGWYHNGTELELPCPNQPKNFETTQQSVKKVCMDGKWTEKWNFCRLPNMSDAAPEVTEHADCLIPGTIPNLVVYSGDQRLFLPISPQTAVPMKENSELLFHCQHLGMFRLIGPPRLTCKKGAWDGPFPRCEDLVVISESGKYATSYPPIMYHKTSGIIGEGKNGELIVYPSTDLQLDCLWRRMDGSPSWMVSHQFRVYPKGWATGPEDDRDRQFRLSIYHAVKDDSGVFSCMTPRGKTNSIVIKVLPVECPLIMPFVPRLLANTSSTRMGTHVSFNCPRGYRLDGPHHLECFPTGHWSDRLPSCSTILCPPINITDPKLRMYSSSRDPQNLAEFSCPSGYRLKGAGTAKCTETGTWSNEPPFCEEVFCPDPVPPKDGFIAKEGQWHRIGDVVEYSCDSGHAILGQSSSVCNENGQWSTEDVQCTPSCNYPGHPSNGRVSFPRVLKFHYEIGERIGFECNENFILVGSENMSCMIGGGWSSELPSCV